MNDYKPIFVLWFSIIGLFVLVIVCSFLGELLPDLLASYPQCYEDAVIVGIGDFEDGLWSEYICGPSLDDFNYDWNGLQ